jgi:DNA-binding response OmpR family regulator
MKHILIIDDEPDFCSLVKQNLEINRRFRVDIATNGKDGLASAARILPDLILLDVVMSGIDGFEVLKRLKADKKAAAIPVIMLTAVSDQESQDTVGRLYAALYILKPVDTSQLIDSIEKVLRKSPTYNK